MKDMTMCVQAHCPLAPDCRRQRSTAGKWTSVAAFDFDENGCAHFVPVHPVVHRCEPPLETDRK